MEASSIPRMWGRVEEGTEFLPSRGGQKKSFFCLPSKNSNFYPPFFFFIYMSIDVCIEFCSASWPCQPSCVAKTLALDIARKPVNQIFIPAVILGITDFCHFMLLSLTLTFARGHEVSVKQNLLAFFFSHTFQLIRMKFDSGVESSSVCTS